MAFIEMILLEKVMKTEAFRVDRGVVEDARRWFD